MSVAERALRKASDITAMSLEEYVDQPWYTTLELGTCQGVQCFVARNPELGSCIGQGNTPEEALDDLKAARADLISVMLDCGDTIPPPGRWKS